MMLTAFEAPAGRMATYLPAIRNDETFYSWMATVHSMNSTPSAAVTSMRLLGIPHGMRQHDFPSAPSEIPLLDGLGGQELIDALRKHTISAYYFPFLPSDRQKRFTTIIQSGLMSRWRRAIGSLSRTRQVNHPLKSCRLCVRADSESVGRAYWHVEFQFPTTWVCRQHGHFLTAIVPPAKRWALPVETPNLSHAEPTAFDTALTFAEVGHSMARIQCLNLNSLRAATVARLQTIGVLHTESGARHERIKKWFASTAASQLCRERGEGLEHLLEGDWVAELLWRKKLSHAVRWVILWSALDWSSAREAAAAFTDAAHGNIHRKGTQLSFFEEASESAGPAPLKVQAAFSESDSYGEVMARLQVSRSDVVRWLEKHPDLRAEWRQRLRLGKQQQCVERIQALAASDPGLTRQELDLGCNSEVRWLREHAPGLLHAMLKSIPARAAAQRSLFPSLPERLND